MADLKGTIDIESHYAKQPDGYVYYYWRVVGSDMWNVQKTAMKEVPYVELAAGDEGFTPPKTSSTSGSPSKESENNE